MFIRGGPGARASARHGPTGDTLRGGARGVLQFENSSTRFRENELHVFFVPFPLPLRARARSISLSLRLLNEATIPRAKRRTSSPFA